MVILRLLLNKTSQQGKMAVKGVRGKERRYRRKAINMPEGKRRYKYRRTCYLSMIARDWFLCFINHSNSKTCSAPFPTLRLILDSVQEGSNDTCFQTSVSCFYFNSLKPHFMSALLYRIHTLFPCFQFIFFSRLRKTQQFKSNNKTFSFFLRWNTEYYN